MSGYFLSPSDKKRGLGKKLITTWEGRELVTWLFLKIYHPLSPLCNKKQKEMKKYIAEKLEIIYIYKISFRPRLFTVFTTHKFLSLVIKTSTLLSTLGRDSKCSQLKKTIKFLRLRSYHLSKRQKFDDNFKDSFELLPPISLAFL